MSSRWDLLDLLTRKIKLRCIKVLFYVHYLFELVSIQIRIKQSNPDPYHVEKQDPDRIKRVQWIRNTGICRGIPESNPGLRLNFLERPEYVAKSQFYSESLFCQFSRAEVLLMPRFLNTIAGLSYMF